MSECFEQNYYKQKKNEAKLANLGQHIHLITKLTANTHKIDKLHKIESFLHWKVPPSGWLKLNVDSCKKGSNNSIEAGVVLRDYDGK